MDICGGKCVLYSSNLAEIFASTYPQGPSTAMLRFKEVKRLRYFKLYVHQPDPGTDPFSAAPLRLVRAKSPEFCTCPKPRKRQQVGH